MARDRNEGRHRAPGILLSGRHGSTWNVEASGNAHVGFGADVEHVGKRRPRALLGRASMARVALEGRGVRKNMRATALLGATEAPERASNASISVNQNAVGEASSSSLGMTANDFMLPSTSVNKARTKCTSRLLMVFRTKSCSGLEAMDDSSFTRRPCSGADPDNFLKDDYISACCQHVTRPTHCGSESNRASHRKTACAYAKAAPKGGPKPVEPICVSAPHPAKARTVPTGAQNPTTCGRACRPVVRPSRRWTGTPARARCTARWRRP